MFFNDLEKNHGLKCSRKLGITMYILNVTILFIYYIICLMFYYIIFF